MPSQMRCSSKPLRTPGSRPLFARSAGSPNSTPRTPPHLPRRPAPRIWGDQSSNQPEPIARAIRRSPSANISWSTPMPMRKCSGASKNRPGTAEVACSARSLPRNSSTPPRFNRKNAVFPNAVRAHSTCSFAWRNAVSATRSAATTFRARSRGRSRCSNAATDENLRRMYGRRCKWIVKVPHAPRQIRLREDPAAAESSQIGTPCGVFSYTASRSTSSTNSVRANNHIA